MCSIYLFFTIVGDLDLYKNFVRIFFGIIFAVLLDKTTDYETNMTYFNLKIHESV